MGDDVSDQCFQGAAMDSILGFKQMLVVKFGSLFNAWRALDTDHNGLVSQKDFSDVSRGLGVKKVKVIWSALDPNGRGCITLHDLDDETAEAFGEFERLLLEKHGSTRIGWRTAFDVQGIHRCDSKRFAAQCRALGYTGDAMRLFGKISTGMNLRSRPPWPRALTGLHFDLSKK